jgi:hypothetical protein
MTAIEVGVISVIATSFIGVVSYAVGVSKGESQKRNRMYKRLDEHKAYIDNKFVRTELCDEKTKAIPRIEKKLDKLLEKNGIARE